MGQPTDDELKAAEEGKREAAWNKAERWRVLQDTITWAESQGTVRRNAPQKCLLLQEGRLANRDA